MVFGSGGRENDSAGHPGRAAAVDGAGAPGFLPVRPVTEGAGGPPGRRVFLRLVTLLAMALLVGAAAWVVWLERERELSEARALSVRRVERLAGELVETLALAKAAIAQVESDLRRLPAGSALSTVLGDAARARAGLLAQLPMPFELYALDADGRTIELAPPSAGASHVRARPSVAAPGVWQVSAPQGPAGARAVLIERAAEPNAHGVAAFAVDLLHEPLRRRFEESRERQGGSVALFRVEADGGTTVLVRVPHDESEIGRTVRGPLAEAVARRPSGSFHALTRLDGTRRLIAYRRLEGDAAAIVVAYGMATDVLLADWRARLPWMAAVTLLLAAALGAGGWRLDRALHTQALQREALARRERNYRTLADHLPDVVARLDREGRYLYANPAIEGATGLPPEAFIGKTAAELGMPVQQVDLWTAALRRAFDRGTTERIEFAYPGPDGVRHWEAVVAAEPASADAAATALVISRDITARKQAEAAREAQAQAEQALRDSEERLRLALQAANQGLYDLDLRTGEAVVSAEYALMLGYDPADFRETNAAWRERLHPDDRGTVEQAFESYLAGRSDDYRVEYRQRTRDGGWKWILSVGRIQQRDAEGRPLRLLGTHTDLTAIKEAQAALQESEARFRVLFDASPVPTLAYERGSLRLLAVNEAFTQLYGYSREEARALRIPDLYPPELRAAMVDLAARVQGPNHVTDIQHVCKDGRRIDVETRSHDYALNGRPGRISVIVDVTEQRRAEAARRAAAERFEKLFRAAPEAISVSDFASGRFLQVNEAFCELFGYTREQLIGRTSTELAMWVSPAGRGQIVERLTSGQSVRGHEAVGRRQAGETIDVLFSAERIDFDGNDALLMMFRDISQRKRLEAALRASEQRFRLAASFGQVWEWDFGAGGVAPTSEFFAGLGYGDVVAERQFAEFVRVVHPDDWHRLREALARHLKRQGPYHVQFRATDAAGRTRWFESQGQALWDERGRAYYMAGTTFEITERKDAEEQVRRLAEELEQRVRERTAQLAVSEARFRTIFESVPVAISEEDWSGVQRLLRELRASGVRDGAAHFAAHPELVAQCLRAVRIVRLNQKALDLHDARDQQSDLPDLQAFYPDPQDLSQFVGELEALWAGRRSYTAKRHLPAVSGRPLNLMMTISLPGLDDDDAMALVCLVDISEIDRLNEELDRSVARLRQVNKELETFTYSVSHDLKAPLRGIDGYSRLLLSDHAQSLDEEGRQFLGHIRQATQHMGVLIDDLLAYSRLERRALTLTALPLAPAVDGVIAAFQPDLQARGVELTVDVDAGLRVTGDAQGLAIALRNLVDNALKFTRESRPARVHVAATRIEGRVRLSVRDNGPGFDMKFHDRIFAIFQRLHRAEEYPGTGVGLAIVRKAMERMGGRVWAESAPGEGATFHLELPAAD